MKPIKEVLDVLFIFTETQKATIDLVITQLTELKDKKIGMETFHALTNSLREIDGLRENVMGRLLTSLKRGDQF